jgi:hypothetical protein
MNCANHPQTPSTAFCRTCGKAICEECKRDVRGVIYCEDCIVARLSDTLPAAGAAVGAVPGAVVVPNAPNPALAAVLAGFFPFGVGQVYNGQVGKAILHCGLFALLIVAVNNAGGAEPLFGLMIAFFYFYQIFDAYRSAKAKQLGLPTPDPLGIYRSVGVHESSTAAIPTPPDQAAPLGKVPIGAVILIGMGLLFFLSNMGMFRMYWLGKLWPLILIFFGVRLLMRNRPAAS